jgi:hypothetical protein
VRSVTLATALMEMVYWYLIIRMTGQWNGETQTRLLISPTLKWTYCARVTGITNITAKAQPQHRLPFSFTKKVVGMEHNVKAIPDHPTAPSRILRTRQYWVRHNRLQEDVVEDTSIGHANHLKLMKLGPGRRWLTKCVRKLWSKYLQNLKQLTISAQM